VIIIRGTHPEQLIYTEMAKLSKLSIDRMFDALLRRGYFPQELPPPFQTTSFAQAVTSHISSLSHPFICDPQGRSFVSQSERFNLARAGTLRRILSIPNPVNYIQLAHVISDNWQQLLAHAQQSKISMSKPIQTPGQKRAVQRFKDFGDLPEIRAINRVGCRYVLKADINAFYPSVYTHSIPWAIHTKMIAKTQRKYNQSLGNKIDTLIRNAQDQQTKGIPIGPDTSLIVAESILATVDQELQKQFPNCGFRYVDDYELCFWSFADAEAALSMLQELLTHFELQLNPNKTKIIELPCRVEPKWVSDLRVFEFRPGARSQHTDIIHFFDCAFELWVHNPEEAVLKYALSRSKSITVPPENWSLYESFLLQCAVAEAGALPIVIDLIKKYSDDGYQLNKDLIRETFTRIVELHAPRGHGSEVAWVIWGSLILQLPIDDQTATIIGTVSDSIVALLALDARSKGLISTTINFQLWEQCMTRDELCGSNWLLCYQAYEHGWLSSKDGTDYIAQDPSFLFLRTHNVQFYDAQSSLRYSMPVERRPTSPLVYTGGY
jgi:Reverse transcriptase (RNA-dependent DNA polymerase)